MSSPSLPSPFFSDSSISGVMAIRVRRDVTISSRNKSDIFKSPELVKEAARNSPAKPLREHNRDTYTSNSGSHRQTESLARNRSVTESVSDNPISEAAEKPCEAPEKNLV